MEEWSQPLHRQSRYVMHGLPMGGKPNRRILPARKTWGKAGRSSRWFWTKNTAPGPLTWDPEAWDSIPWVGKGGQSSPYLTSVVCPVA